MPPLRSVALSHSYPHCESHVGCCLLLLLTPVDATMSRGQRLPARWVEGSFAHIGQFTGPHGYPLTTPLPLLDELPLLF